MGIAVQAPADTLLAIVPASPAGDGATGAAPLTEGMFAALLAGILDSSPPATEEPPATESAPLFPAGEPGDQDPNDPALALLASFASPQPFLPLPAAVNAAGPTTGQGAPAPAVAEVSSPVALATLAGDVTATSGTPEPAPAAEAPAPSAPVDDEVSSMAEAASAGEGALLPAPVAASPVETAGLETASPPAESAPDMPGRPEDAASPAQPIDPGPAAGDAAPAPGGVVRPVGNASESDPGQGDSHPGRKTDGSRPLPRASATGIAHAAPNSAAGQLREQPAADAPAALPADAPPPPSATAELPPQVDQVASAVIDRVDAGGGEARIHLEPLELGEVVIHVRTDGDEVRIDVRAERPDAARLLRDHTQDLSSLLGSRGLNLSDVNVGVGGGNADGLFESRHEQPRPAAGEFAAILGLDDAPSPAGLHNRLRAAYNPDGALLYRV
jgi:hypothetical protein